MRKLYKLREMTFDDLDEVCEIENAVSDAPWSKNGFFSFMIMENAAFLVATVEEKVVGYAGIVCAADEADITNVCVDEHFRNQGIGRMLVEGIVEAAVEKGAAHIHLEVREGNDAARHLYSKLGFVEVGIRKEYYELSKENAIIMSREVI